MLTICLKLGMTLYVIILQGDELNIPYADNVIILIFLLNAFFLTIEG